jgi:hypothetical protein
MARVKSRRALCERYKVFWSQSFNFKISTLHTYRVSAGLGVLGTGPDSNRL